MQVMYQSVSLILIFAKNKFKNFCGAYDSVKNVKVLEVRHGRCKLRNSKYFRYSNLIFEVV